jgi:hypothetical protein
MRAWILCLFAICIPMGAANADGLSVTGSITQSTSDGTGPAANNPSLNGIADGDSFTIDLNFPGSISAPGTYNFTGGTLVFSDPAAPATEDSFGAISLTVALDGSAYDISLFGCLTTGDGCFVGNSLSLNFAIPSANLNSASAPATPIFGLNPPLDLLEDDGLTDIQGNVATYSYNATAPEPTSLSLLCCGFLAFVLLQALRRRANALL